METTFNYPISINGKVKTNITFPVNESSEVIEKSAVQAVTHYLEGKEPKAVIFRRNKMINIVI